MKNIIPILVSSDLNATEEFYSGILNFETTAKHEDYLVMISGDIELHFSKQPFVDKRTNNCACYIRVTDIQFLYEKCREAGCVHPNGKLAEMPWGNEFAVTDSDFNLIKFSQLKPSITTS